MTRITIELSDAEAGSLQALADRSGETPAELVRRVVVERLDQVEREYTASPATEATDKPMSVRARAYEARKRFAERDAEGSVEKIGGVTIITPTQPPIVIPPGGVKVRRLENFHDKPEP